MFIFSLVASIKTVIVTAFNWCMNTASKMIMSNLIGIPS